MLAFPLTGYWLLPVKELASGWELLNDHIGRKWGLKKGDTAALPFSIGSQDLNSVARVYFNNVGLKLK